MSKSNIEPAWWELDEGKTPLPASLQKLLDDQDPAFLEELEKFAFSFSNYQQKDKNGKVVWKSFEGHLRKKDASWLWALYLHPSTLAREGLKRILSYKSLDHMKSLSQDWNNQETWLGDYATHLYATPFITSRTNQTKYSLTKSSVRFFPYLKAIYKSVEKRLDNAEIWATLAYRFDVESVYNLHVEGLHPSWKPRSDSFDSVYTSRTHYYLQRRSWRTLRKLGKAGSCHYVPFATELLLQYQPEDINRSVLTLMRVLYHQSKEQRYRFTGSSAHIVKGDVDVSATREEAFPELWDQRPDQLLRILEHSEVAAIVDFARKALELGHADLVLGLEDELLFRLLASSVSAKQLFAAKALLNKRAKTNETDIDLLCRFSLHVHPEIRKVAFSYLNQQLQNLSKEELQLFIRGFVTYISSDDAVSEDVVADWNSFLQESGELFLPEVADWNLTSGMLDSDQEVLQNLGVLLFRYLDPREMTGNELLPYFAHPLEAVRLAVRNFLHLHFASLRLDVPFLASFATISGEEHQVFATQFFTDRLLWAASFGQELIQQLWVRMLQRDLDEGVRTFVREVLLGTLFFSELASTSLHKVLRLVGSDEAGLQDFGARLLQLIDPHPDDFTEAQLLELAHSRLLLTRQVARDCIAKNIDQYDADFLVSLAETDWDDTREWMFSYFRELDIKQLSPKLIYGLLDTARSDIQKEAMKLVAEHEDQLDLVELMMRASESTDLVVQEYACSLWTKVECTESMLQELDRFIRTVLFRVHAGRKAKKIMLAHLLQLAEQKEALARLIIPILTDLAAIQERRDLEKILYSIAKIQAMYPEIPTPITVR
ncbi:hypothetical protein [Risungbinella massiliensis]|uniref:hypothetical protein n=1 Tax=Risungbinella massiliensis TaxID=1329796 RepID=UPI0005CBF8AD|nr:hypothetical protein [Risungbinella massiliensis]